MKYVITFFLATIVWAANAQQVPTKTVNTPVEVAEGYQIDIVTSAICVMCKDNIERDLAFEKGVKKATLDVESKVLRVVYNERKTDPQTIRERVAMVGYHADTVARDTKAYEKLDWCCKDGAHGNK